MWKLIPVVEAKDIVSLNSIIDMHMLRTVIITSYIYGCITQEESQLSCTIL